MTQSNQKTRAGTRRIKPCEPNCLDSDPCKVCKARKAVAAHYLKNRDQKRAASRLRYQLNKQERVRKVVEWQSANPALVRAAKVKYQKSHPERVTDTKRKSRSKHTKEHYEQQLLEQLHQCAVCDRDLRSLPTGRPVADHDHRSGLPRGVLCHRCNVGLGWIEHNLAPKMKAYLELWARKNKTI